jgi:exodeoxyribonuclease III
MKRFGIFIVAVGICFNVFGQKEIKIITWNVLEGLGNEACYGEGRRERCIKWLKNRNTDVIALQEMYEDEEKLSRDAKSWGHNYYAISGTLALTSNRPVTLKHKYVNTDGGFWHGVLHCETHGLDFLVVHLCPADWKYRLWEAEMIKTIVDTLKNRTDKYIVLGDFNAHSPFDSEFHLQKPDLLKKYEKGDKESESRGSSYRNLTDNHLDYSVMSDFLSFPLVDVTQRFVPLHNRFTFPTPILIGVWRTAGNIGRTQERIDYILASPELSRFCKEVTIYNNADEVDYISDHYPVEAVFELQ